MEEIPVLSWAFSRMGKFPFSEEMDHLFKDSFFLHDKWMAVGEEEKISHSLHFRALYGDNSIVRAWDKG